MQSSGLSLLFPLLGGKSVFLWCEGLVLVRLVILRKYQGKKWLKAEVHELSCLTKQRNNIRVPASPHHTDLTYKPLMVVVARNHLVDLFDSDLRAL